MVSLDRLCVRYLFSVFWITSFLSYTVSIVVVNYTADTLPNSFQVTNYSTEPILTTSPRSANSNGDVVAMFLEQVEKYEQNKDNCTTGTQYNLGKGVIQQYGKNRFKPQALVSVNRANFLTRIWRKAEPEVLNSEYLFYTQVRNMLEGDAEIFAAGNCYDYKEFNNYELFCPYAHRIDDGTINVKDLSIVYPYLGNDSEWFHSARMRASKLHNFNYTTGRTVLLCKDNLITLQGDPDQIGSKLYVFLKYGFQIVSERHSCIHRIMIRNK